MKNLTKPFTLILILFSLFTAPIQAQEAADESKPISEIEAELAPMAREILRGKDTDKKFELNKQLIVRLTNLLKRPESYSHKFDSLTTISILKPADNTFRIFTWYIVDKDPDAYYAENAHYHFGLIQRRYITQAGKTQYIVIPLMEMERIPRGFESIVTDNYNWLGALYYKPKNENFIQAYDGSYYKLVPTGGEVEEIKEEKELVYTYIPGKYKGRTLKKVDKLSYDNHKRVKEKVRYYVLMGWNGWDNKSDYKVLDVLTFDPEDSTRAMFGAPVFYFGSKIPKARALFKYSAYAPFSLNVGYVKSGPFKMFKKKMIIYDHLAPPRDANETKIYDLGPDGSHDAISYFKKHGGYFEWYRDIEQADKYGGKKHRREMEKLQKQYIEADSMNYQAPKDFRIYSRAEKKAAKQNQKEMERQRKEAERKLKESGIDLGDARNP